jgi:hypothetical protein
MQSIQSSSTTAPNNAQTTFQPSCATGSIVTGGGYSTDLPATPTTGWLIVDNRPISLSATSQGWRVVAINTTGHDVQLTVWMVCVATS